MNKAYNRIVWRNAPSVDSPLNEGNLNKIDIGLNEVDNRVIELDTTKLDIATANKMVKSITFAESTGIFTITYLDGTTSTIDTKLEKIATNFRYDADKEKLILTLIDGTTQEVDLASLINNYDFTNTGDVNFTVTNGKVSAEIKNGSVTEDKLQPNYLADIKVEVAKANNAGADADKAKSYAVGGTGTREGEDTDNAKYYCEKAKEIVGFDTYTKVEIDGFLDGKSNTGHTHTKSDIDDFPSAMPPTAHEHTVSDISNFPSAMPPTAHTHTKSEIGDFPTEMKPTAHTHALGDSGIVVSSSATPTGDYNMWCYYT